jgi:hypothetical protein
MSSNDPSIPKNEGLKSPKEKLSRRDFHATVTAYVGAFVAVITLLLALAKWKGGEDPKGKSIPTIAQIQLGFSIMAPSLVSPPKIVQEHEAEKRIVVVPISPISPVQNEAAAPVPKPANADAPATIERPAASLTSCIGLPKGLSAAAGPVSTTLTGGKYGYVVRVELSNNSEDTVALIASRQGKLTDDVQNQLTSSEVNITENDHMYFNEQTHKYLMASGSKIDAHQVQMLTYTFSGAAKTGSTISFDANLAYAFGDAPPVTAGPDPKEGFTPLHCDLGVQKALTP